MTLIHNERVKLTATALNGAALACFTVGIATPLAAVFYNLGGIGTTLRVPTLIIGLVLWLFAALVLHLGARKVLGDLRP